MKSYLLLSLPLSMVVACAGGADPKDIKVTITASSVAANEGDRLTLKANITGGIGEITYKWEQTAPMTPKGSFTSALNQETQFVIPGLCADATFDVRLNVKDADGNQAAAAVSIGATNSDDTLRLDDVIVSKTAAVVVGDLLTLTAAAVGPGCGPKYAWSQTTTPATGGFEGAVNESGVKWRAPEVAGTYKVNLVISDDAGNALPVRETPIVVENPQYTRDIKPTLNGTCGNCHGGTNPAEGLRLTHDTAGAMQTELLRGPTGASGTLCGTPPGSKLIDQTSLNNSILWQRINLDRNDKGAGCDQMPRNNQQFFVTNKDLYIRFKIWIQNGAVF